MSTDKKTPWKWAAAAGVVAVMIAGAGVWSVMNTSEDPPPPIPPRPVPLSPLPASRSVDGALSDAVPLAYPPAYQFGSAANDDDLRVARAKLSELYLLHAQRESVWLDGRSNGGNMYWGGRRADDPASNPKVLAYLKKRGITDPERANDLFIYQWQVDELDEPDAPAP